MGIEKVNHCIHCGACTDTCVFLGKYKIDVQQMTEKPELAYHCFLCNQCQSVCPMDISGSKVAIELRRMMVEKGNGKLPDNSYDGLVLEKYPYKFANYRHGKKKSVLFTGCNFPSFYPETTEKLVKEFKKYDVGVVYDCCGKPIGELGLKKEEQDIFARINKKMNEAGVEEIVMVCPNCYYYLKDHLDANCVTVYQKMKELGIGHKIKEDEFPMYYPCPDRISKDFMKDIRYFLEGEEKDAFPDVQCCGLGGCAAGKEADLAQKLVDRVAGRKEDRLYTYCASCICSYRRRGYTKAEHILPKLLDVHEIVPLGKTPILNRMKCKFK